MSWSNESLDHSHRTSFTIDVSKDIGVVSSEALSPMKTQTNSPFLRLPYQNSYDADNSTMSASPSKASTSRYANELLTQPLFPSSINRTTSNPLFPPKNHASAPIGSQRISRYVGNDAVANHDITPFTMRVFSNPSDERFIRNTRAIPTLSPPTAFTAVLRSNVSGPLLVLPTVDDEMKTWMESKRRRSAYVLRSSPVAYRSSSTSNSQLVQQFSQVQYRLSRSASANHDVNLF